MRTRKQILDEMLADGIVAIVRLRSGKPLPKVAEALHAGGLNVMEFTMNTPDMLKGLRTSIRTLPDVLFGAGTILNHKAADQAIDSGAEFIVSPNTKAEVMEQTHLMGKVSVPGAYTPTEVALAVDLYADIVKLFPAGGLGPEYIRELMGPYDQLKIMPTGGVSADNILDYFRAGVCAVAAGGSLVNDALVDAGDYTEITRRARELRDAVDAARKELA
ncbi:MAG: bifunctional 4-hydroxy-2-oxoglutarate aldolase/2-dehydro-3-deoxy-phosphogluconate aldolase [Candidatus Hydrogenedentota bacterium]